MAQMDQNIFDPNSDLFKEAMEKGINPENSIKPVDLGKPEIHTTQPQSKSDKQTPAKDHIELHIDEPQNNSDHFVLNLKQYNLNLEDKPKPINKINKTIQKAASQTKKVASQIPQKISKPDFSKLKSVAKDRPKTSKLKENIKFIVNTCLIFIISFIALNWQAYSQVGLTYYNTITGQTDTTLTVFSEQQTQEDKLVKPSSPILSDQLSIPQLNSEITPPGSRIIIPSINSNVPVIDVAEDKLIERNWSGLEQDIQDALRSGVVHYPGTPLPGQSGNIVITGHSSYYPWDPGRFKDVFALLHNLNVGDEIIIFHRQKKYTYQVSELEKVFPYEVNVLNDFQDDRLTLITCTPIGTNLKRLIVTAKPV